MLKIGITGGMGVGKTIVTHMFAVLGVPVYDADSRAKWVMHHHEALRQELLHAFGPETFSEQGELNRTYLAGVVLTTRSGWRSSTASCTRTCATILKYGLPRTQISLTS